MNTLSRGASISIIMSGDTVELKLPDLYKRLNQYLYLNVLSSMTNSY